ncbi:hypothetical protein [Rhodopila sp.]|uniref:hypothetical protein n=1 Tax=Rhodopila sp. TaxID=2480087 RepID=UPI003D0F51D2
MIGWGRGLPVGLCVAALGLCLLIAAEIVTGAGTAAPEPTGRTGALAQIGPTDTALAPDRHGTWLEQILARPLFSQDRRPVEVAAAGVAGLPRLTGVVVTESQRVAIFAPASKGHPIIAQSGAHIGEYEVKGITDAGVTVAGPRGTTLLRPAFDPAHVPPVLPVPVLPRPLPIRR